MSGTPAVLAAEDAVVRRACRAGLLQLMKDRGRNAAVWGRVCDLFQKIQECVFKFCDLSRTSLI